MAGIPPSGRNDLSTSTRSGGLCGDLGRLIGADAVLGGEAAQPYVSDATEAQGFSGWADAVVFPSRAEDTAEVIEYAHRFGLPITPRGGGTGYAGGCVPAGGIVIATEKLNRTRSLDPLLWRGRFEAGVTTRRTQRIAQENGLYFPVDPGAAEQSTIGGNIATNAGGPHTFKYGVMRAWVTGLEVVVTPGHLIQIGGATRKDVAGYDLSSLLVGSEGTLGVITAADLKFMPAVEARFPVVACFDQLESGCAAVEVAMASGCMPAAIEYLDGPTLAAAGAGFPSSVPEGTEFMLIVEADGTFEEATVGRANLCEALVEVATQIYAPEAREVVADLWRWREGIGIAADGYRAGKVSEDIAVPTDRLADAVRETQEIGKRHGLVGCSWGHAGDGNLHSTFLIDRDDGAEVAAAERAADDLFALAARLGGTISGEHGLGLIKSGHLNDYWSPDAVRLHRGVKALFDPENLLNPGKKLA